MTTNKIWSLYAKDVKYFILSKVKDITIADDLVQDTFIKVHIKLPSLKDQSKIKSWIFSIARNITFDYFRNNLKIIDFEQFETTSEFELNSHSKEDCLFLHIKNLEKKYRNPLFLSDIKGIKQADVALQLKLPLSTVKSRIQRARKKIAQAYIDCCDYTLSDDGVLVGDDKEIEDCTICN